jgi:hypothetical protein
MLFFTYKENLKLFQKWDVFKLVQLTFNVVILFVFLKVDHLTRKPKDGERSLREILSILHENDISPFEVTQSGLVPALLTFLTKKVIINNYNFLFEDLVS